MSKRKRLPTETDLLFAVVTVGEEEGRTRSRCVAICTDAESARFIVNHNASLLAEDAYYRYAVIEAFVRNAIYGYPSFKAPPMEWFRFSGDGAESCDAPEAFAMLFNWWG